MGIYPVSETKGKGLQKRMEILGIREADLVENFIRGSGAGGQKINKTSVVVQIRHIPTGVQVRCQGSRSQAMNRFLARRLLVQKIEEKILGAQSARRQMIEKIRRQKRRRSRRARENMLEGKKRQSEKKNLRRRPEMVED